MVDNLAEKVDECSLNRGRSLSRGIFCEFRGSVPVRENIIREYCISAPRPLALVPDPASNRSLPNVLVNVVAPNHRLHQKALHVPVQIAS